MKRAGFLTLIGLAIIGVLAFQYWLRPMLIANGETRRVEQVERRTGGAQTTTDEQVVRVDRITKATEPGDEGRRARRDAEEQIAGEK